MENCYYSTGYTRSFKKSSIKSTYVLLAAALLLVCFAVGACLLHERALEINRTLAVEELEALSGTYDEDMILLSGTSLNKATKLAEKFGAELRISFDGKFAALSLPQGVTIKDIYSEKSNRKYIEDMSPDFFARISDAEEEPVDEIIPIPPSYTVTDSGFPYQDYIGYLNIGDAWTATLGANVTVAVIDTGIDTDHPEFEGRISEYSYNATEDKIVKDYILEGGGYDWSLIEDEQGHGTKTAGVLAASMNGQGTVGVAPNVNILVIKCECTADGTFTRTSDLVFALYYAIEQDVAVVNMSFGGSSPNNPFEEATKLAVDSDIICVASAGNNGSTALSYPAADENVIGVGALEDGGWNLAYYSNYGENLDLVAPGTAYAPMLGGKYTYDSGTSLACPSVAGAIALYCSQNEYVEFADVTERLYASCRDLGDLGRDIYFGYGALDIDAFICGDVGTVSFNMLTDELKNTEQMFIREHTLQALPEPERLYAVFDGWYYDIECTDEVQWYQDIWTTDLTLYANWVNEDDGVPYTYVTLDDGTVEIRSYTGKRRYITIPDVIDDKIVSSIGDFAFDGQSRLRSVRLPSGLTHIGENAFGNCDNIVSIGIPDSVTEIERYAFFNSVRLSSVDFGVRSSLKTVGQYAFAYCPRLVAFDIPASVESLNGSVFFGDTGIRSFRVGTGSKSFKSADGVLFNITGSTVVAYPAGITASYQVPAGTDTIGVYAFGYSQAKSVTFDTVTSIGEMAFSYSLLESAHIPDSVTALGSGAFSNAFYLNTATIGNGITEISPMCFMKTGLSQVTVPESVRSIGEYAFCGTSGMTSVVFAENSGLTQIKANAFSGSGIVSIAIPDSCVSIEDAAFASCSALSSVTFGENSVLNNIGKYAFTGDVSLLLVSVPQQLRSVGDYAFCSSGLTAIDIPASVTELGIGAFADCQRLENIFVDDANTVYTDVDGVVYSMDGTKIHAYPSGNARTSYTIENTVTEVYDAAFYGSNNLNSVVMPPVLTAIGEYGFYGCTGITGYALPETLKYIEAYAFAENRSLGSTLSIPDNVVQIGRCAFAFDYQLSQITFTQNSLLPRISYGAFAHTGLTSFLVPSNVSSVSQYAFAGCDDLGHFVFAENSKVEAVTAYMFIGCENLQTVTFLNGSSLSSIQAHGFEGMRNLTNVNFGDAPLTNIDNYAFRFCENLNTLTIPDGVTYIGRFAFYGCSAMSQLTVPASIDFIGRYAFHGTGELDLYFTADTLPANLQENWDSDIRGYYVGVQSVVENDIWKYAVLTSGGVSIIEYRGADTEIDLTTTDFGGNVSSIGGHAFEASGVRSIVLPATLTSIHRYAFAYSKLEHLTIPDGVTFIGSYAFYNSAVASVSLGADTTLTSIERYAFSECDNLNAFSFPTSLRTLGKDAFANSALTSVDMSNYTLTEIPEGAFRGTKLASVTLPDSVVLINHNAFRDCELLTSVAFGAGENLQLMSNTFYNTGLTSLHIPENLTYVGEYSFVGLRDLTAFTVDESNAKYTAVDGLLYSKDGRKLIACPAGRTGEITLPQSLEVLGFGAFENSGLTRIRFNENSNILTFGYRCFYNSSLTEIDVPASVVSFDYYAFAMCKNLTKVNFAENNKLNGIYEGAFYGCGNLTDIVIPDNIIEISDYAFYGCDSLGNIPINSTNNLKGIYDYAFAYCGFDAIDLPDSLIDIGEYAFLANDMTEIVIPNAQSHDLIIGLGAFAECKKVESITLPFIGASFEDDEITWFGYIFGAGSYEANITYVPASLKTVLVHNGITEIGYGAFYGLTGLERIDIPSSVTACYGVTWYGTSLRRNEAFKDVTAEYELNLIVPEGVVSIAHAFSDVRGLSHVELPDSVNNIDYAFFNSGLESIIIPAGVTEIGDSAFSSCERLKTVVFHDKVTAIGASAFQDTAIEQISLPDSIVNIGGSAFSQCKDLREIVIPDSVTTLGSSVLYWCLNLERATLPAQLTEIPSMTFFYCESLTDITLPQEVTAIGDSAFSNCHSLKNIAIPSGVISIGQWAFNTCMALETLTLPGSLERIGVNAFYECSSLKSVEIAENDYFFTQTGVLYNKASFEVVCVPGKLEGDIIIPDGVTDIGNKFANTNISSISIPESLTSSTSYAQLYPCERLMNIRFGAGTTTFGVFTLEGFSDISIYIDDVNLINDAVLSKKNVALTRAKYVYVGDEMLTEYTVPALDGVVPAELIQNFDWIKTLIIPEGVTEIGEGAFRYCNEIKKVVLPSTLASIGNNAFNGCYQLHEIVNNSSIELSFNSAENGEVALYAERITDSAGTTTDSIGNEYVRIETADGFVFLLSEGVYTLSDYIGTEETVTLPLTVNGSQYTMKGQIPGLKKVIIPEGFTSLPDYALSECYNLTEVTVPASMTSIPDYVFWKCDDLRLVTIEGNLDRIGYAAFSSCTSLETITFAGNVKVIGEFAFSRCLNLEIPSFPNGLTEIGNYAFQSCYRFTSVSIPDSVVTIGDKAFNLCTSLTEVDVGRGLQSGLENAFSTEYIESISVDPANPNYTVIDDVLYNKAVTDVCFAPDSIKSVTIPATVTNIGTQFQGKKSLETVVFAAGSQLVTIRDHAFNACSSLKSITFPDNLVSIGLYAFRSCTSLTSIVIPSCREIGYSAFDSCSSLTSVSLPDGLIEIKDGAFSACSQLTEINIPDTVETIGKFIFNNGPRIYVVHLPANLETLGSDFNTTISELHIPSMEMWLNLEVREPLIYVSNYYFDGVEATELVIPEGVTKLRDGAFSFFKNLKKVTLPSTLVEIGNKAFYGCENLEEINIPDNVETIGDWAFNQCSSLKTLEIPDSVTSIGESAFDGCSALHTLNIGQASELTRIDFYNCSALTSIFIPSSCETIGEGLYNRGGFYYCNSVQSITVGEGNTAFTVYNGALYNAAMTKLVFVPKNVSGVFTVPEGVTEIGNGAFAECKGITEIVLPDSFRTIGSYAFYGCTGLETITLPDGIASIGEYAFYQCSSLREIALPEGLTDVEYGAFSMCTALETFEIPDSITDSNLNSSFWSCYGLKKIIVSPSHPTLAVYDGILYNKDMTKILVVPYALNGTVTLPGSLLSVGSENFNSDNITELVISSGTTTLSNRALGSLSKLTKLTLPDTLTSIPYDLISDMKNLYELVNNSSLDISFDGGVLQTGKLKSITDKNGITTLSDQNFRMFDDGDFRFAYFDGKYMLMAYTGDERVATLPLKVNGEDYYIGTSFSGAINLAFPEGMTKLNYLPYNGGEVHTFFRESHLDCIYIPSTMIELDGFEGAYINNIYFSENSHLISIRDLGYCDLTEFTFPDGIKSIGGSFGGWPNLSVINIPDGVTSIQSFVGTAFYNNKDNWNDGLLTIGTYLIDVDPDIEELDLSCYTCIASEILSDCHNLKTVKVGSGYISLRGVTNLETLVLSDGFVCDYSMYMHPFGQSIPTTLKNIVFEKGARFRYDTVLEYINGVTIYCEEEYIDLLWDYDYENWNNGNMVYYGGTWAETEFRDTDGTLISSQYRALSQVIRQPYMTDRIVGKDIEVFIGWDSDGDGEADFIPATSDENLYATAIYERHTPGEWIAEVEATCTADGKNALYCLDCGELIDSRTIKATGHTSGEETVRVLPTCTEEGYILHTCTVCNEQYRTDIEPALGHTHGEIVADTLPTCLSDGVGHTVCSRCNETVNVVIPAVGHNYVGTITRAPTCTTAGEMTYTCSVCHETTIEAINSITHDYVKTEGDAALLEAIRAMGIKVLTFSENNREYYYKCSACGKIQTTDESNGKIMSVMSAMSEHVHTTGDWAIVESLSSKSRRVEILVCTDCSDTVEIRTIDLVTYTVVFEDYDGSVISSEIYNEGETVIVPDDPTRIKDDLYLYFFTGWDKEVTAVTGDVTYTALYDKVSRIAAIKLHPVDYTGALNSTASFSVVATGDGLSYQWQWKTEGTEWINSGKADARTATITQVLTAARNGYQYRCVITDAYGNTVISNAATMNIEAAAVEITSQPVDFTGALNSEATFSVVATGEGLRYQWQWKTEGTEWINSGKADARTATITQVLTQARNGYQYRCVITDAYGNTVISNPATMNNEATAVEITAQPANYTGALNSEATFSVIATGDGLSYQWQWKSEGTEWINSGKADARTATITQVLTTARNGYQYRCVITDAYGNTVISNAATMNIEATAVEITAQPANYTGALNSEATFNVVATGEGLSYRWQWKSEGTEWINSGKADARTATITQVLTAARNGYQYRCVITDAYGNTVISNAATMNIEAAAVEITSQPSNYTGALNSEATFNVTATGEGLRYQWQWKSEGTEWINSGKADARTATITQILTQARNGYQYRCIITDAYGNTVISNAATMNIEAAAVEITAQPANYTGALNSEASFNVVATGEGLRYQWQWKSEGTEWINSGKAGARTATITQILTQARNGYQYRCIITDAYGNTVTSNAATMSIAD